MGKLGEVAREAEKVSLHEAKHAATVMSGPESDDEGHKGVSRYHSFDLDYVDERRGRTWSGKFKCKVLSVKDQIAMGRVMSSLRGNVPPQTLDLTTLQITEMLAHLTVALEDAPPWARGDNLLDLHDLNVIGAIYKEVRDHEGRFWGADPSGEDAGDGEEP